MDLRAKTQTTTSIKSQLGVWEMKRLAAAGDGGRHGKRSRGRGRPKGRRNGPVCLAAEGVSRGMEKGGQTS